MSSSLAFRERESDRDSSRAGRVACGPFRPRRLATAGLLLCAAILLGCSGDSGPPRYKVSGTVTYAGKPIPSGRIVLEPDPAQGNKGPAAYASIQNGHYETPEDKGCVGGPHIVRISGTDGKPGPETPQGMPLFFPEYRDKYDFPKEDTTKDFHVPARPR